TDGTGDLQAQVFSPDGALFATGSWDNHLRVYETRSWKKIMDREAHLGRTSALAISPDGWTIVTAGIGGQLKLWNLARQREIFAFPGVPLPCRMKFSRDGTTLLVQVMAATAGFQFGSSRGTTIYTFRAPSLAEIDRQESRQPGR